MNNAERQQALRLYLAVHETGHALMHWACAEPFQYMALVETDGGLSGVVECVNEGHRLEGLVLSGDECARWMIGQVAISFGGIVAEDVSRCRPPQGCPGGMSKQDREIHDGALADLAKLGIDRAWADAQGRRMAEVFIGHFTGKIRQLALHLVEKGRLTWEEFTALLPPLTPELAQSIMDRGGRVPFGQQHQGATCGALSHFTRLTSEEAAERMERPA